MRCKGLIATASRECCLATLLKSALPPWHATVSGCVEPPPSQPAPEPNELPPPPFSTINTIRPGASEIPGTPWSSSSRGHLHFYVHSGDMHILFAWILTILYWIVWPVIIILYYIVTALVATLKLLYWPIGFLLQPVVYLGRFILACLALPIRALIKLEVSIHYMLNAKCTYN